MKCYRCCNWPCSCRDGQTIIHGDCREFLPELPEVDLVLTDPPYFGLSGEVAHEWSGGVGKRESNNKTVGDLWCASFDWVADAWPIVVKGAVVFCSYHSVDATVTAFESEGGKRAALFTWYKRNSPPVIANVPRFTTEFAWGIRKAPGLDWRSLKSTLIDVPLPAGGCMASERILDKNGQVAHPTQKPLAVIMPFLKVQPESVLDPFCGTGTTLVAAKSCGVRSVGIELEERYCEIAANRLRQGVIEWPEPVTTEG